MKTFLIQASAHVYGGHKFWAERFEAASESSAKAAFHKKYGIVGWIRGIAEVK